MTLKCECGGTYRKAMFRKYDFSAFAGLPVVLQNVPGLRCSKCGDETLEGTIINAVLQNLALEIAKMPRRLDGERARYLRKRLSLSQKELAEKMGIARETVGQWECGATEISPQHDHILRGLTVGFLARELGRLDRHAVSSVLDHVRTGPPKRDTSPLVIDKFPKNRAA